MGTILDELRDLWDPWASVPAPIPYFLFGGGSNHPFEWYFDGPTRTTVSNPSEIESWLLGCTYVPDATLFGQEDHWLHPGEFEVIRMGDCDDHALWAWRKFVELGYRASLVSGKWKADVTDHHVYLVVTIEGEDFIFEATSKVLGDALRPFEEARAEYLPHFSVNEKFQTRAYLGTAQELLHLSDERQQSP